MRTCMVEECDRPYSCEGYCNRHYQQIHKYGKILYISKRTRRDKNEINIDQDLLKIKLYNADNEEIAEAITKSIYELEVRKYKWHLSTSGYVKTSWYENKQRYTGSLHQLVVQFSGRIVPDGYEIDHLDTNKLNCLDDNLRICTHSENSRNVNMRTHNTSGYKGVIWNKIIKRWIAQITVNGEVLYLGSFFDKEAAAKTYNTAAIKYHGKFAVLNVIQEIGGTNVTA